MSSTANDGRFEHIRNGDFLKLCVFVKRKKFCN